MKKSSDHPKSLLYGKQDGFFFKSYFDTKNMLISAIEKSTLVDFPGKMACIVFTLGCNFRCPFCHNPECVLPDQVADKMDDLITPEAFFNFLETRKWFLDWVSICGWEPTMQKWLYEFIKKIKEMWFLVKLDTNGRDADIIKKLLDEKLIDYVAVDAKHSMDKYSTATWIWRSDDFVANYDRVLCLLKDSDIDFEYRTTVSKWLHTPQDIRDIAEKLKWIPNYYIQNFVSGKTLDPEFSWKSFSEEELEEFKEIASEFIDDVKIRG